MGISLHVSVDSVFVLWYSFLFASAKINHQPHVVRIYSAITAFILLEEPVSCSYYRKEKLPKCPHYINVACYGASFTFRFKVWVT